MRTCNYKIDKKNKCQHTAWQLNSNDTYHGELNNFPTYERINTYKCEHGHLTYSKPVIVTWAQLHPPKEKAVDTSVKRFHRKGFKGHKVNPPNYRLKAKV